MISPWMDNGTLCQFVKSELYNARDDCIRLVRGDVHFKHEMECIDVHYR
jgi:hypothetical protein